MLSADKIAEIEDALAMGQTIRATARNLKISRGIVQRVSAGRLNAAMRTARELEQAAEHQPAKRAKTRCPTCGAMATTPCLACQLQGLADTERARPDKPITARHWIALVPTDDEERTAAWPDNEDPEPVKPRDATQRRIDDLYGPNGRRNQT